MDVREEIESFNAAFAAALARHDVDRIGQCYTDDAVFLTAGMTTVHGRRAIVELGDVYDIFERARHPYTKALTHSVPTVTGELRDLVSIPGAPPDLISPPKGCAFHPRCPHVTERCRQEEPKLEPVGGNEQQAACWNWRDL